MGTARLDHVAGIPEDSCTRALLPVNSLVFLRLAWICSSQVLLQGLINTPCFPHFIQVNCFVVYLPPSRLTFHESKAVLPPTVACCWAEGLPKGVQTFVKWWMLNNLRGFQMKIKVLHEARVGSRKPLPIFSQLSPNWIQIGNLTTPGRQLPVSLSPIPLISHGNRCYEVIAICWKSGPVPHNRRLCSAEGRCEYSRGSTRGYIIFMNYHHLLKPSTFLKFPKITIPLGSFSKTVGDIG